ncbi:MAG: sulfite exporter TauE/SafE family protein [Candidatus Altiarchaeota archaeon]
MFDPRFSLAGLVVGVLVGLTGMGGGAMMTPILILLMGVKPLTAVGTDLVYAGATKIVGAIVHYRNKTVDLNVAGHLIIGGVPGSVLGVWTLKYLGDHQYAVDQFIRTSLGLALICISLFILIQARFQRKTTIEGTQCLFRFTPRLHVYTIVVGFLVGLLVGVTSVGSGVFILVFLLLLHPIQDGRVVGTDILTATFLVGAAGVTHLAYGNVDMPIVASILAGSLPGVYFGSHMHVRIPIKKIRIILAAIIMVSGVALINAY